MLEDFHEEIAARLTMHEFMLEVLLARHLAEQPGDVAQGILSEIQRLKDDFYTSADTNPAEVTRVAERSGELQENFLRKAAQRADQIRLAAKR